MLENDLYSDYYINDILVLINIIIEYNILGILIR